MPEGTQRGSCENEAHRCYAAHNLNKRARGRQSLSLDTNCSDRRWWQAARPGDQTLHHIHLLDIQPSLSVMMLFFHFRKGHLFSMSVAEDPVLSGKLERTYQGEQQSSQAGVQDVEKLMKEKHKGLLIIHHHFWHNWEEQVFKGVNYYLVSSVHSEAVVTHYCALLSSYSVQWIWWYSEGWSMVDAIFFRTALFIFGSSSFLAFSHFKSAECLFLHIPILRQSQ